MRIGIDVRYLSHGLIGGVHTYLINLVPALLNIAREHRIFLYADNKCPFELHDLPAHVTLRLLPYHNPLSSVYHDFFMRRTMVHDELDVVHFPANYGFAPAGARAVITLHDAINILPLFKLWRGIAKNPRTLAMMTYLHFCSTLAVRRADLIITVSAHAAREIALRSGLDAQRIVSIHHAPPSGIERIEDAHALAAVRAQYGLSRPFVLADALKNPEVLVRAWRLLPARWRENAQIVFFARRQEVLPIVHEAVAAGYARLLIRPARADLSALYSMAEAFVFPSWIEGFGLPVLEAMTCGAPVIASDRGSIPEVAGDAAILVDAQDARGLAEQIERVLTDSEHAHRLRARGLIRAKDFSWENSARKLLDCYERVQNQRPVLNPAVKRKMLT